MPLVDIRLNVVASESTVRAAVVEITEAVHLAFDGNCPPVMISWQNSELFIDRADAPAALVVVRFATDLEIERKRSLCRRILEIFQVFCGVDPRRVFLQLSRLSPDDAWNCSSSGPICVSERTAAERAAASRASSMFQRSPPNQEG